MSSDTLMFLMLYPIDIHYNIDLYRIIEELLVSHPSSVVGEHHLCEKPYESYYKRLLSPIPHDILAISR